MKLMDVLYEMGADPVIAAVRAVQALGQPNPFDERETVIDNSVLVEVSKFDKSLWISSIRTVESGQGNASRVLDKICAIADEHGVRIRLDAKPFGSGGLSKANLTAWYKRHGFKPVRNGSIMERPPASSGGV
jgi:hypothetical protein